MERDIHDSDLSTIDVIAKWTPDCQDKQDYDSPIISLSTRYWPRGGGFTLIHKENGQVTFQDNDERPTIPPHAHASILLEFRDRNADNKEQEYYSTLTEADFTGETEDEVKRQVEEWSRSQIEFIAEAIISAYRLQ